VALVGVAILTLGPLLWAVVRRRHGLPAFSRIRLRKDPSRSASQV